MPRLVSFGEPHLSFRYDGRMEDPRDGLTLFGPLDAGSPHGMRVGVVGTPKGIRLYRNWIRRIQRPISLSVEAPARPMFPGFEAVYGISWPETPSIALEVSEEETYEVAPDS